MEPEELLTLDNSADEWRCKKDDWPRFIEGTEESRFFEGTDESRLIEGTTPVPLRLVDRDVRDVR